MHGQTSGLARLVCTNVPSVPRPGHPTATNWTSEGPEFSHSRWPAKPESRERWGWTLEMETSKSILGIAAVQGVCMEKEMEAHSSILSWRIPGTGAWWAAVYGVTQGWTRLT